jgi:hypothetical protein
MADLLDALFEALMTATGRADDLFQRYGAKAGLLALPLAALVIYALAPAPYVPDTPCPADNTSSIGLMPQLWWVGGGQKTPALSSVGLDPNSRISYQVLLGTSEEDMQAVGMTSGGRRRENLHINITTPLDPGTVYLWQVVAKNSLRKRSESEVWTFSTRALPVIEQFEANRSVLDVGDSVVLSWSISNAKEAEIKPEVGEVPLRGEMKLIPEDNVTYTLTARNFAGEANSFIDVAVFAPQFTDSMAGGWSTHEDGWGSVVQNIKIVAGVDENATRISYDLVPEGWVGITKLVSTNGTDRLNLAGTDGLKFFCRGSETTNALEIWLRDANGTIYGRSWEGGEILQDWTLLEAGYEDLGCVEEEGSRCSDETFDFGNVTAIYFIVKDRESQKSGSSGWIAIDDLEAFRQDGDGAESLEMKGERR